MYMNVCEVYSSSLREKQMDRVSSQASRPNGIYLCGVFGLSLLRNDDAGVRTI